MNGHYAMYYTTVAVAVVFPFFFSYTHIHTCVCAFFCVGWDDACQHDTLHIYAISPPPKNKSAALDEGAISGQAFYDTYSGAYIRLKMQYILLLRM